MVANGDVSVELRDADQQVVATGQGTSGTLQVVNPHLWQPGEGYLYELCVTAKSQTECDIYLLRVGIRSVAVKGEQFLINHKPFYFTGFEMCIRDRYASDRPFHLLLTELVAR